MGALDLGVGAVSARFVPQTVINSQKKKHTWRAKSLCAGADVIAIAMALGLAAYLVGDGDASPDQRGILHSQFAVAMLSLPIWLFAFSNLRLYMSRFTADRMEEFRRIVHACLFGVMSLAVVGLAVNADVAREWPALAFCFAVVFVAIDPRDRPLGLRSASPNGPSPAAGPGRRRELGGIAALLVAAA